MDWSNAQTDKEMGPIRYSGSQRLKIRVLVFLRIPTDMSGKYRKPSKIEARDTPVTRRKQLSIGPELEQNRKTECYAYIYLTFRRLESRSYRMSLVRREIDNLSIGDGFDLRRFCICRLVSKSQSFDFQMPGSKDYIVDIELTTTCCVTNAWYLICI